METKTATQAMKNDLGGKPLRALTRWSTFGVLKELICVLGKKHEQTSIIWINLGKSCELGQGESEKCSLQLRSRLIEKPNSLKIGFTANVIS